MDSRKYFILATAIAAIATGSWLSWQVLQQPELPRTATLLPAPAELADFTLSDQHGNTFSRNSFKGRWSLVFFGFTHCPDICPLTLQVLAEARRDLQASGVEALPDIVLVSVDPERDSPEVMGRYVSHFGDGVTGVSGDLAELRKLTTKLGIYFEKSNLDDDNYSVDQSAVVIVVNPDGNFVALFSAPHRAANFVHDVPILMARP
jgi:protein SCO1/2